MIYLSAYSDAQIVDRMVKTLPLAFIVKPASDHDLFIDIELGYYCEFSWQIDL